MIDDDRRSLKAVKSRQPFLLSTLVLIKKKKVESKAPFSSVTELKRTERKMERKKGQREGL